MNPATGEALQVERAMYPVEPRALANSIAYLDRHDNHCLDEIENWQEYGEAVMLVLHELKRLRALSPSQAPTTEREAASDVAGLVEQLLWHVEQVCGELSRTTCVTEHDDDRSILEGNFTAILRQRLSPSQPHGGERAKAIEEWRCRRCGQDVDMVAFRCGCTTSPSPWEPKS